MAFIKRLGFYLVGLSIGLIFLTIFLKKKSEETGVYFCYLPNCRVLKDLRSKPIFYSEGIRNKMKEQILDSTTISYFLNEGDIDFGKSNTESTPCKRYLIEGKIKEEEAFITVDNCPSKITIKTLELTGN